MTKATFQMNLPADRSFINSGEGLQPLDTVFVQADTAEELHKLLANLKSQIEKSQDMLTGSTATGSLTVGARGDV